jgi:hypothetical protein
MFELFIQNMPPPVRFILTLILQNLINKSRKKTPNGVKKWEIIQKK